MAGNPYDTRFFNKQVQEAIASAQLIVPLVLRLTQPRSVIDVGCGRGAWLKTFKEAGVGAVRGVDGSYVGLDTLLIEQAEFRAEDLSRPFHIDETFDMAVCLEVAEHLPPKMGPVLVKALTEASPIVLFSAA